MQHLVITNNIVHNNLLDIVRSGKEKRLRIARGKYVSSAITDGIDEDFGEFDLAVLSCLHTVWQDASNPDNTFSVTSICRMLGYTSRGGVSQTAQMAVATSIMRLENITLRICPEQDFEPHRKDFIAANDLAEFASSSWDDITKVQWDSSNPLIEVDRTLSRIPRGSTQITAVEYTLTREPLLHLYSRITGQFVTIDGRYMHPVNLDDDGALTESSIAMTPTRIGMAFWCARQAERIRYAAEHPPKKKSEKHTSLTGKLLLQTIFDRVGLDKREASKHKGRHTDFLSQLMSCWTEFGLIPAWQFIYGLFHSPHALVLDFSSCTVPAQDLPADAPAKDTAIGSDASPAPETDTTIGAVDTIIGALHAIIGAISASTRSTQKRIQSHFRTILGELEDLRMYCKYSTKQPPAIPGGAGDASLEKEKRPPGPQKIAELRRYVPRLGIPNSSPCP